MKEDLSRETDRAVARTAHDLNTPVSKNDRSAGNTVRNETNPASAAMPSPEDAHQGMGRDPVPMSKLDRFQIQHLVGRGGMGNVYLAYDQYLRRPVALKFPRMDSTGNPQLLEQFLREARLAAQLNHPNLVKIYEVDVWGQDCFIASEWCEGGDLSKWIQANPGPQNPQWSARIIRAMARAIAYCHQQNIVHLDIKPANIILTKESTDPQGRPANHGSNDSDPIRPVLTDFGVARVIEEGLTMTHTSLLMGTPMYMAPEQAEGNRTLIGPKSDIFSLGIVLYELLYGVRPFEGESAMAIIDRIREGNRILYPTQSKVPADLRTVCERCLQHSPKDRYPSADALAEDLDRYLRGEPILARPVSFSSRLKRWLEKPERMVAAGITGLAIQSLFLVDFLIILFFRATGVLHFIEADDKTLVLQLLALAVIFHLPCIVLAIFLIRRKIWALIPSILFTGITFGALLDGLITGRSTISAYDDQPVAMFLVYTIFSIAIGIQLVANFAAIPAAIIYWKRRRG